MATTLNGAVSTSASSITLTSATGFALPSDTTLSADIEISSATIAVADSSSFPAKGTIKIGSENIIYTGNANNTFSGLTRGADSTTAATASSSAAVKLLVLIQINNELVLYDTVSTNTLSDLTRSARNTSVYSGTSRSSPTTANSSHSDGDVVVLANDFSGWGNLSDNTSVNLQLRLWCQDNFGEDLVFNAKDNTPYYCDRTLTDGTRATS